MKIFTIVLITVQIWNCYAPPVTKNEKQPEESKGEDLMDAIHYHKYLKQVVNVLESDESFKKKLEEANEEDIKSGKIAHELDFVSHHVRTQLDELKRIELERLIDLKHDIIKQGYDVNLLEGDPLHGHLDNANKHTFEIEDLKKLIAKTTDDLADADRRRREEFKQYELEKDYKREDALNHTKDAEERAKLEKHYKDLDEKHKKHEPLHEPGHKAQLEEVWREQDHMQQKFDPAAFFDMHDVNSDHYWDENEVKALFINELNKMYQAGMPEDDLTERAEEMERMREHAIKKLDTDKDKFISRKEFLANAVKQEFNDDAGWQPIDSEPQFSPQEQEDYRRQQQMLHQPPHQPNHVPPGGYPPQHLQAQYYPGQQPQQYYQPPPQHGQYPPAHPPQYQQYPNNPQPPPVQQYQPVQNPPIQQVPNQAPQYQQQQQPGHGAVPVPVVQQNQPPPPPPVQQVNSPQVNQQYVNPPNPHQAGIPVQAP